MFLENIQKLWCSSVHLAECQSILECRGWIDPTDKTQNLLVASSSDFSGARGRATSCGIAIETMHLLKSQNKVSHCTCSHIVFLAVCTERCFRDAHDGVFLPSSEQRCAAGIRHALELKRNKRYKSKYFLMY